MTDPITQAIKALKDNNPLAAYDILQLHQQWQQSEDCEIRCNIAGIEAAWELPSDARPSQIVGTAAKAAHRVMMEGK